MDQNTINRINELARKSKGEGLTLEEKEEQRKLRAEYIAAIRMNMRAQLDNIDIQEKDGTIINLGEKYGRKKRKLENIFSEDEKNLLSRKQKNTVRKSVKPLSPFRSFRKQTAFTLM